ncbi:unnamed protein product [Darwinula stevensoni]|uniref:Oplophorus-luciferin 2-monooxygenase non-catalytic subunit n=1 Tax=Darwinula stevensoni TaxID=69355 RepID=A0A7R9FSJ7_9CRUS|nr:unnamed protein product [Darwinula stevensoni]CAG0903648.1 unnamed protein product [Darwinula stevensoni]
MPRCFAVLSLFVLRFLKARGQSLCPVPDDISPCFCYEDEIFGFVVVDCSPAASGEEIFSTFNDAVWPVLELGQFRLTYNEAVQELPEGVFGDKSFSQVIILNSAIGVIHPTALFPSRSRLNFLMIAETALRDFPVDDLSQFAALGDLFLSGNALTRLPPIGSDALGSLIIDENQITTLEAGSYLPNLQVLHLEMNPISEVQLGFFTDLGNLRDFRCNHCDLGPTLPTGSFEFYNSGVGRVFLQYCGISSLEPGAMTGFGIDTEIYLENNDIRELTEAVFRPMVEIASQGNGLIHLHGELPAKATALHVPYSAFL